MCVEWSPAQLTRPSVVWNAPSGTKRKPAVSHKRTLPSAPTEMSTEGSRASSLSKPPRKVLADASFEALFHACLACLAPNGRAATPVDPSAPAGLPAVAECAASTLLLSADPPTLPPVPAGAVPPVAWAPAVDSASRAASGRGCGSSSRASFAAATLAGARGGHGAVRRGRRAMTSSVWPGVLRIKAASRTCHIVRYPLQSPLRMLCESSMASARGTSPASLRSERSSFGSGRAHAVVAVHGQLAS